MRPSRYGELHASSEAHRTNRKLWRALAYFGNTGIGSGGPVAHKADEPHHQRARPSICHRRHRYVLEIVVSSRPVTFTCVHTRQVCSDHTALRARAVSSTLGPRPSIRSSGTRSEVASQRPGRPYAWSTRLEHSARSARSPRTLALALSPRALSRSLPSLSIVGLSLSSLTLSACGGFLS
jgi:hypothetical protein